jgi:DNA-binding response OmpR family regulator
MDMKKILIIEDDLNIAELERDYLRLNDYIVDIEPDGEKACQKALNGKYDAIIVDLMMPGRSGFDIIKEVRKKLEIPVIVVSACMEDIDKVRGLNCGADDYLTKPFSPTEFAARVKSHIGRYERLKGSKPQEDILSYMNLEITHTSHKVLVSGEEVKFTAKEYELLYFLASHPNQVFTKEHLFYAIWGEEEFGDWSTVPVHIQKIRRKIEKDPSSPEFIETLWGTGYRFNS